MLLLIFLHPKIIFLKLFFIGQAFWVIFFTAAAFGIKTNLVWLHKTPSSS